MIFGKKNLYLQIFYRQECKLFNYYVNEYGGILNIYIYNLGYDRYVILEYGY